MNIPKSSQKLKNGKERSLIRSKAIVAYTTGIFKSRRTAFLAIIVFVVAVSTKILPSFLERLTADSCTYLDIGRNLFSGKGFSISYNLYQYWANTPYYPAAPLYPPLFPFLAGIIWNMFHSLTATILLNVFLAGINSVLFYYLLRIVYKDNGELADMPFWTALLLSIGAPMQQTSMFAWTEQLSLLFLLVAVTLFIKDYSLKALRLITIGILFGLGFLTRVDMVFCFAAISLFLIVQRGIGRESIRACLCLLVGFLLIALPYELLCIVKYKLLYPAYVKVNSVGYMKAVLLGGSYDVAKIPVLQSQSLAWADKKIMLMQIPHILNLFVVDLIRTFNFLVCFLIYRVYVIVRRNYFKERIFLALGIVSLLIHSLFLSYQPRFNYIDIIRFGLVHFLFFFILAMAGFYDFCLYLGKYFQRHYRKLFYAGLFIIAFSVGRFAIDIQQDYFGSYRFTRLQNNARDTFFGWVRGRTSEHEVVAIAGNLIQETFPLSRPIVSVPAGAFLNPKNMSAFFSIYKPSFVIMDISDAGAYQPYIASFANETGLGEPWHRLYCVYKIDYPLR